MLTPPEGILAALSDDDRQALLCHAEQITFRKGDDLLRDGQANGSLFIVLEGLLHVLRPSTDREILLGRLQEGSCFGEISLFDPGPVTGTVRAASDGVAIELRRDEVRDFATQRPSAAVALLVAIATEMAKRIRQVDQRLVDSILWGGLMK